MRLFSLKWKITWLVVLCCITWVDYGDIVRRTIILPEKASPVEQLAARLTRLFIYQRTGSLYDIVQPWRGRISEKSSMIIISAATNINNLKIPFDGDVMQKIYSLKGDDFLLWTIEGNTDVPTIVICGATPISTVYGAVRFGELLGIRFYLDDDSVPDYQLEKFPAPREICRPLFQIRGIQPFHDFPEGPDWWNADDYKAVLGQLIKLKMNFIGLHTYPEARPNAEPTVWIGLPEDIGDNCAVKFAYPASFQNTIRGNWGYSKKNTSNFNFGASLLFDRDDYSCEIMRGMCPEPNTQQDACELFRRTGTMFRDVFGFARQLSVRTCIGTETPLVVPEAVKKRLKESGKDPDSQETILEIYKGMFQRIMMTHPLDYYWFWTPEGWTWEGTTDEQVRKTINDLNIAIKAAEAVKTPFRLATCGWVLGPQQNRALFDKVLPKDIILSCINRQVGFTPVDPAFSNVVGRSKWAIPWLEDDPALTSPQLWAGRMRRDAADAKRYGCDGLIGIHWRTKIIGPTISALARAAWDQSGWSEERVQTLIEKEGVIGGNVAEFPNADIQGADVPQVYRTVRYDLKGYKIKVAPGNYTVILKFCEPFYKEPRKRVFGVSVQDKPVAQSLDIFDRVGANHALDIEVTNVLVNNSGWLSVDFIPEIEFPCIAGIVLKNNSTERKINCGGPAVSGYEADLPKLNNDLDKYPPVIDFYKDWALNQFGPEIATQAAQIFSMIDGRLPRPSDWVDGPGGIKPDSRPWNEVVKEYSFVEEFSRLRDKIKGNESKERFDYWDNTFQYMRRMARLRCLWHELNEKIKEAEKQESDNLKKSLVTHKCLPLRIMMVQEVSLLYSNLFNVITTRGELGTIANWEQHILPSLFEKPELELERILGQRLPQEAKMSHDYRGQLRVIVPTRRTLLFGNEALNIELVVMSETPIQSCKLYWRPLGAKDFVSLSFSHRARGVFFLTIPEDQIKNRDFEYFIEVKTSDNIVKRYPSQAPSKLRQVIVLGGTLPESRS